MSRFALRWDAVSRRGWWIAVAAYAAVVCVLSVMPVGPGALPIDHLDWIVHLCEYLVFA